ncbi:MAG: hypothetical protein RLZZ293_1374 [Pseudomonadota bacterium]
MEIRKKVIIRQFQEISIKDLLVTASKNFINNFIQSKIPIGAIQSYQNTTQLITVLTLAELKISPKIILLIIMFL